MSSSAQAVSGVALKNILYATDFSPCSSSALPYVHAIAKRYGSTVHVVHACSPIALSEQHAAEHQMEALLSGKVFSDIAYTSTVDRGELWEILNAVIETKTIDVIVLGTHGRRGMEKLALGSQAEKVFRHAQCPVLTFGPFAVREVADASFARILFATDYSPSSGHALQYALSLTRVNRSHLMLLHVMEAKMDALPNTLESTPPGMQIAAEFVGQAFERGRRQLAEMISPDTMQQLNPEIIVECGSVARTILSIAKNREAHLIVMGAHRAPVSSIVSHLPWATASSIICQAHCPVLTARN